METRGIGRVRCTFKPGKDNLVAGVIIGLLMIAGGIAVGYLVISGVITSPAALPLWAEHGWCWAAVAIAGLVDAGLLVGGILLIAWMRNLASMRVDVGPSGFSVSTRTGIQVFLWDEIASVTETHLYERPPVLKGPAKLLLPEVKSRSYLVRRKDAEQFAISGTTIRGHEALAGVIKAGIGGRDVSWEIVEEHA